MSRAAFHHEVVIVRNCPSAAAGLNIALKRAESEFVVCVHQGDYLPEGWDRCRMQQLREAGRRFGPIGVAGVYGVGEVVVPEDPTQPLGAERIGWVNDRGRVLRDGPELPARVATLDEIVLVVRRGSGLRFDPELGCHLYGADVCLQAGEQVAEVRSGSRFKERRHVAGVMAGVRSGSRFKERRHVAKLGR